MQVRVILCAALALLCTSAGAEKLCVDDAWSAMSAMVYRQGGIERVEAEDNAFYNTDTSDEFYGQLAAIEQAYNEPVHITAEAKRDAINRFSFDAMAACMESN